MAGGVVEILLKVNSDAAGAFNDLGGLIRENVLSANLLSDALEGAFGAALDGAKALAGQFTSMLGDAADVQARSTAAVSGLMTGANLSFQQATNLVGDFRKQLATLAGPLPGVTKDFTDFASQVTSSLEGLYMNGGVLDQQRFEKALVNLSRDAVLQQQNVPGLTAEASAQAVNRFLSGTDTWKSLEKLDFFQKNATVRSAVQNELGDRKLTDLSPEERLEVLQKALALPPEILASLQNTADASWQGFVSKLTDPDIGVFSFFKDLDPNQPGTQSILTAFNESAAIVFGDDGILATLGSIFSKMGFPKEPLLGLYNKMEEFNSFLKYVNEELKNTEDIKKTFADTVTTVRNFFTGIFNQIVANAAVVDWNATFKELFDDLAGITNWIFQGLSNLDWIGMGAVIGKAIAGFINELPEFFARLDWGAIGSTISGITAGVLNAIGVGLISLDWKGWLAIGSGLLVSIAIPYLTAVTIPSAVSLIAGSIAAIFGGLPLALIGALAIVAGLLVYEVYVHWDELKQVVIDGWNNITRPISTGFKALKDLMTGNWSGLVKDTTDFIQALMDFVLAPLNLIRAASGKESVGADQKLHGANAWYEEEARKKGVKITQMALPGQTDDNGNPLVLGQDPNAAPKQGPQNFWDYINTPIDQLPIFGGGGNNYTQHNEIHVNGITDPQQVADHVGNHIAQRFSDYKLGKLAPATP